MLVGARGDAEPVDRSPSAASMICHKPEAEQQVDARCVNQLAARIAGGRRMRVEND
jgi:hypothetical protein